MLHYGIFISIDLLDLPTPFSVQPQKLIISFIHSFSYAFMVLLPFQEKERLKLPMFIERIIMLPGIMLLLCFTDFLSFLVRKKHHQFGCGKRIERVRVSGKSPGKEPPRVPTQPGQEQLWWLDLRKEKEGSVLPWETIGIDQNRLWFCTVNLYFPNFRRMNLRFFLLLNGV